MNEKILIPFSIVVAGGFIALAIFFTTNISKKNIEKKEEGEKTLPSKINFETEYIDGNSDADIFFIDYSDLECIYCKRYNENIIKRIKKFSPYKEKVAFVYRSFPIVSKHPSSMKESIALECAGKEKGGKIFYQFKNKIFDETKSDGNFPEKKLIEIAESFGIEKEKFKTCLGNPEIIEKINTTYNEATSIGLSQTPAIFVQTKNGQLYPVPADYIVINNIIEAYFENRN